MANFFLMHCIKSNLCREKEKNRKGNNDHNKDLAGGVVKDPMAWLSHLHVSDAIEGPLLIS